MPAIKYKNPGVLLTHADAREISRCAHQRQSTKVYAPGATRSNQKPLRTGLARSNLEQLRSNQKPISRPLRAGATRSTKKPPGAARSGQERPEAANQEQPCAARGNQEQPGAAKSSEDAG